MNTGSYDDDLFFLNGRKGVNPRQNKSHYLKACYTLLTIMTFMAILTSKMRESSARKARIGMFGGGY